MMAPLEKIAAAWGTESFARVFAETYPEVESISIDYAVLERRSAKGECGRISFACRRILGGTTWGRGRRCMSTWGMTKTTMWWMGGTTGLVAIQSEGNYVYAPGKMVALLGVDGLVVVETDDALLITTRDRSQDVSKVVRQVHEGWGGRIWSRSGTVRQCEGEEGGLSFADGKTSNGYRRE